MRKIKKIDLSALCNAQYLRTARPCDLRPSEEKQLRIQREWEDGHPKLTREFEAIVCSRKKMQLAKDFETLGGSIYPKGMPVKVITHWRGNLIVYNPPRELVLSVKRIWVVDYETEEEEVQRPSSHRESRTWN